MSEDKKLRTEIIDFMKYIIDRSGMRSLITLLVDSALLYFVYLGKLSELYATIGIVTITIVFFIVRHFERNGKEKTNVSGSND